MQTKKKKCFKKGLGAASVGVSQVFAPCCTHCALLWFLKLRAMSFSNTYVKQLAGNSCGTSPPEVLSAARGGRCPRTPPRLTGALTRRRSAPPHPELLGTVGVRGSSEPRARRASLASPWLMDTGREWGWERPLALSWSISPPLSHLTVLSAEKGNFSITAVKLISYLHWMDLL